ncbi:mCG146451, partial [Mus musculus]
GTGGH